MHDEIFEQLFGLGNGDFEHKFSKYQVPGGLPKGGGGMLKWMHAGHL